MIKTIKPVEKDKLIEYLYNYYTYISENKQSLLTKYFGLYRVKIINGSNHKTSEECVHFVVMNNITNSENKEEKELYDLKGSD